MHFSLIFLGLVLTLATSYGTQFQIQMPEAGALMSEEDIVDQIDKLKHNVSELWENFSALKSVLTETLNHLRVHQAELEETVHMLEHKHDGDSGSHGSYTDDHHHHSGEQHSHGDDHSHDSSSHSHGDDHHHHSGEQHSHGDDHSHGGDSHSHSAEQHSHSDDHHHSTSHSHSHGDSHEKSDYSQQSQQGSDSMVEPLVMPSSVQQHYHHNHQQPHLGLSNSLQLINDSTFNGPHHHHHHHTHSKTERNRTVVIPKYSEVGVYDFAICNVQPNRAIPEEQQQEIMGRINLWQKKSGGPLNIHLRLQGFDVGGHHQHHESQQVQQEDDNETPAAVGHRHGFHIHSFGDLSNSCQSTGPHFNPKNVQHGGPNDLVRHAGDLGNIECDDHGNANILFNDGIASLIGPNSIIGKSMVIHAGTDDFGLGGNDESLRTGNAGTRIACCIIEKVDKLPIRSYKFIKAATPFRNDKS